VLETVGHPWKWARAEEEGLMLRGMRLCGGRRVSQRRVVGVKGEMQLSLVAGGGETSPVFTLGRQGCMRTEFCRFTGRPSPPGRKSVKSIDG